MANVWSNVFNVKAVQTVAQNVLKDQTVAIGHVHGAKIRSPARHAETILSSIKSSTFVYSRIRARVHYALIVIKILLFV